MSSEPEHGTPPSASQQNSIRKMLIPLALGQFLCSYANSALNVSISDIAADLGTTVTGVQTSITLFTLVMAALMITGSKLTDIWGRKWTFLLGILVFGGGATIAALAPAMGCMVLGFSLGMGIASALLIPPIYILTTVAIDDLRARAAAFGIIGGAGAVGSAAGPLIGGIITTGISWRATFLSEALLALVILILSRSIIDIPFTGAKPKLDITGAALSAAGMAFMIFGLLQAGDYGWLRARQDFAIGNVVADSSRAASRRYSRSSASASSCSGCSSGTCRRLERAGKEPLVHRRVLTNGVTNLGLLTQNFQWFVLLGTSFVVSVYLQTARGAQRHRDGPDPDARDPRCSDRLLAGRDDGEEVSAAHDSLDRVRRSRPSASAWSYSRQCGFPTIGRWRPACSLLGLGMGARCRPR